MVPKICSVNGCMKPLKAKELCDVHYRRNRLNGDPLLTRRPGLGAAPAERLVMHTTKSETCWIFGTSGIGYGKVAAGGRSVPAHRLAWELANGPIPPGMVVRHKCDVKRCVRPEHLEIGTPAENSHDMTTRDRQAKGERQGSAKLSERDVMKMRQLAKLGATHKALSEQFGVSKSESSSVVRGLKWSHLPEALPARIRRLSEAERRDAMSRIEAAETHSSIARDLGVSRACISQIAHRARRTA